MPMNNYCRFGIKSALIAISILFLSASTQLPISEYELQVSDQVTLAGLLDAKALKQLKDDGAVVVDLRTLPEGVIDESSSMQKADISYYNLPIGRDGMPAGTENAFAALLKQHPDQPVVVHCRSGNRAGLLWATHLMNEGATPGEALSSVDKIVTSDGIIAAIKAYVPEKPEKPGK